MAAEPIRAVEGTNDFTGDSARRFDRVLEAAAAHFPRYGYERVHLPLLEPTELFARAVGAATDIVEKEMYTFSPGKESLTLRPEGTAGAIRAYLQRNLAQAGGLVKLWYDGPMFRRERPQKGRHRQFHQIGVEAVGAADPLLDAETIVMGLRFFESLGIAGTRLRLNSIGCPDSACRPAYREALREAVRPDLPLYCPTCRNRYERNVLRVLDCKSPECKRLAANLPKSHERLCAACAGHFETVREALAASGAVFDVDYTLVRGLDYYTRTVFEYAHSALGAQDALGGGGRYDGLVEELGGKPTPAVGLAVGLERILLALAAGDACRCRPPLVAYGVSMGESARRGMMGLVMRLRAAGLSADMDYEGRSLKSQMRAANRREAVFALILGEDELSRGEVVVKDLRPGGTQRSVALADYITHLATRLTAPPENPDGAAGENRPAASE